MNDRANIRILSFFLLDFDSCSFVSRCSETAEAFFVVCIFHRSMNLIEVEWLLIGAKVDKDYVGLRRKLFEIFQNYKTEVN